MELQKLNVALSIASVWGPLLPLGVGLLRFRRIPKLGWFVWFICLLLFTSEQLARVNWEQDQSNLVIYHGLAPLLALTWMLVYRKIIKQINNKVLLGIGLLFIPFAVINAFWLQNPFANEFNSHTVIALSILMIGVSGWYFYETLWFGPLRPDNRYFGLIAGGNLLYFSGALFLFLCIPLLERGSITTRILFILNALFNITRMVLFAIALWKSPSKIQRS